jgi:hypothetical protein
MTLSLSYARHLILGLAVLSSVAVSTIVAAPTPRAHAIGLSALATHASSPSKRHLSNSVTLNVQGGNAFALATCLNTIAAGNNANANVQANDCANQAVAVGGDVVLKNVRLTAVQLNSPDGNAANAANSVNLTIQGGNAAAIATCANVIMAGNNANGNAQANDCMNVAFAQGGNVILKNVRIKAVQAA